MSEAGRRGGVVIALSFIIALGLAKLPMPDWAELWRPSWVALVLIYWCIAVPERTGVIAGWVVGLLVDVMSGTLLGQHGLAFAPEADHTTLVRRAALDLTGLPPSLEEVDAFLAESVKITCT